MTTHDNHIHTIDADELTPGSVLISPKADEPLALDIHTNKFTLSADEPVSIGGSDSAPSPYEFLLSGLGSCTAITMKIYAKHKAIEIGDFHIALSHQRDENGKLVINKELIFHGDWEAETMQKLVEISHKCPMHKDLSSSGITINTHAYKTAPHEAQV